MRVRISYSTTADNDYRRAINVFYGKPGLATRAEVRAWVIRYGSSEDDNLMASVDTKMPDAKREREGIQP